MVIVVTGGARGLDGFSALAVLPWGRPITWLVHVMPIFFLVGGFANAASLTSHNRKGGNVTDWLLDHSTRAQRAALQVGCHGLVSGVGRGEPAVDDDAGPADPQVGA
ncbi:hypothetical protein ACIBAG_27865 [Streptomyces sp. NPDC051243]|uniref:hypothetical protein n=1 Tax=Streptomyces sp. NPDC051243 TaxID=3365646 RepID=UPI0037B004FB